MAALAAWLRDATQARDVRIVALEKMSGGAIQDNLACDVEITGGPWAGSHRYVLRKDAPDEVILSLNATEEVRIPREEIEEMRPGAVSIMPSGLEQQLTPRDLADLVAFLRACK